MTGSDVYKRQEDRCAGGRCDRQQIGVAHSLHRHRFRKRLPLFGGITPLFKIRARLPDVYKRQALFENCFPIPRGVSYNSYCLLDEKTVLFDTVDWSACRQLLENLAYVMDRCV